jgi:hypothetical protein
MIYANLSQETSAVNTFSLFETERFTEIEPISNTYWDKISPLQAVRNLKRELFQQVVISKVSDNSWDLSPPTQNDIYDIITDETRTLPINLVMIYAFRRPKPPGQQEVDKPLPYINILDPTVSGA